MTTVQDALKQFNVLRPNDDDRVIELFNGTMERILTKDHKRNPNWLQDYAEAHSDGRLSHIADWLRAAVVNNDAWLEQVDDKGIPKKLMKCGDIARLMVEADKAMRKANQRIEVAQLDADHEQLYAQLDDGYSVVKLLTPEALDRESKQMQHCIGHGGYDQRLFTARALFLSLRDRSNNAHATAHIDGNRIVELQGKQNKPPLPKYLKLSLSCLSIDMDDLWRYYCSIGEIVDAYGKWHPIDALPKGFKYNSTLNLTKYNNILNLPNFHDGVFNLPEDSRIVGSLQRYARVGGQLTIGEGTRIEGDLDIHGRLALPENMEITGRIHLYDSNLKRIPDGVKFGSSLNAFSSDLESLPENKKYYDELFIEGSKVTDLPEDLDVGCLRVGSGTKNYPKRLRARDELRICFNKGCPSLAKWDISNSLSLVSAKIEALPENLSLSHFTMKHSTVERFPELIEVMGKATFTGSEITRLPRMKIQGTLILDNTAISTIPDGTLPDFRGQIHCVYSEIAYFPAELDDNVVLHIQIYGQEPHKTTVGQFRKKMAKAKTSSVRVQNNDQMSFGL
ncbi:PcfJ domain-containing protein [Mesorhizobium sp. SP-1A]|uniref:PcfJ domain-containing protein n=1 Tax=Mesorhizobium sp. SP-1A TaxID=3077840 RepID=UPI0028F6D57C|nr:PcfJ domain-containing protein [Mesorhizobium sp. SP-1A]